MGIDIELFVGDKDMLYTFVCAVCTDVSQFPVLFPCTAGHIFCKECIGGIRTCPNDREPSKGKPVPPITGPLLRTYNNLKLTCPNKCSWTGALGDLTSHSPQCTAAPSLPLPPSPSPLPSAPPLFPAEDFDPVKPPSAPPISSQVPRIGDDDESGSDRDIKGNANGNRIAAMKEKLQKMKATLESSEKSSLEDSDDSEDTDYDSDSDSDVPVRKTTKAKLEVTKVKTAKKSTKTTTNYKKKNITNNNNYTPSSTNINNNNNSFTKNTQTTTTTTTSATLPKKEYESGSDSAYSSEEDFKKPKTPKPESPKKETPRKENTAKKGTPQKAMAKMDIKKEAATAVGDGSKGKLCWRVKSGTILDTGHKNPYVVIRKTNPSLFSQILKTDIALSTRNPVWNYKKSGGMREYFNEFVKGNAPMPVTVELWHHTPYLLEKDTLIGKHVNPQSFTKELGMYGDNGNLYGYVSLSVTLE